MTKGLRRYEFSERLAGILGESRRDVRYRVTMLVTGGIVPPGPRGPGSPPATPAYAAELLIGVLAAPQQVDTLEAVRCYRALEPTRLTAGVPSTGVFLGSPDMRRRPVALVEMPILAGRPRFGEALARLLNLARESGTRDALARDVFGVWVGRGFPVAAIQLATWSKGGRAILTQRYELPEGGQPPAWLDPERGGSADPGLLHTVFLPVHKLIEIGGLTSADDERKPAMPRLGPTISGLADLADLARQRRHRRPWEKFLSAAAASQATTDKVDAEPSHLSEVAEFGSNPGNLRMWTYVPEDLPPDAPLVVVLHGCTQTAHAYDHGTGWSTLADRHAFAVLLPEQRRRNNPLRCFNWFKPEDTERGLGEALSIRQMVDHICDAQGLDRGRVFVTGVSAGGAMTSAMLATYPETFAGGAIIAGVPYRSANGLQEGFEVIFQGRSLPAAEWGDLIRAASPHRGAWPKVSVWHGAADKTVTPLNAEEIVKQWADVHGFAHAAHFEDTLEGHRRRVWRDAEGNARIESITVAGMGHGVPIQPDGENGCGTPAPFILNVGVSSSYQIACSWGLTETRREVRAGKPRPEAVASIDVPPAPKRHDEIAGPADRGPRSTSPSVDLKTLIGTIFEAAEGSKSEGAASDGERRSAPGGINVQSILTKSFEAAGLLKPGTSAARAGTASGAPLGIDIPGIIATSFEAAGLLHRGGDTPPESETERGLAGSGWEGEGWKLLGGGPGGHGSESVLFGQATSGTDCTVGNAIRAASCRVALGPNPRLSYARRVELKASVNPFTEATFSVLVDGVPIDEASAVGMDYAEETWTRRDALDLTAFAGRTVPLTFELSANANVFSEVSAKAWIRGIVIEDAETVGAGTEEA